MSWFLRVVGVIVSMTLLQPALAFADPVEHYWDLKQTIKDCRSQDLLVWLNNGYDPEVPELGALLDEAITCKPTDPPGPWDNPDPCFRVDELRFGLVSLLLEFGANPLLPDGYVDRTPILIAAQTDCAFGSVQALLDAGADPNINDSQGRSALFLALDRPDGGQNARWLIHGGSDVGKPDPNGLNPLLHVLADPQTCRDDPNVDPAVVKSESETKVEEVLFSKLDVQAKTPANFVSLNDPSFFGSHTAAELLAARSQQPHLTPEQQDCFAALKVKLDYRISHPLS